jgi:hypothetical protein
MNNFAPYRKDDPFTEDLAMDAKLKEEGEEMEEKNIEVAKIVKPAVSTEEALQSWKQYEDLKARIITENDVQKIQGKDFLKKSYWRKIATFFNLSLECVKEERQMSADVFTYLITYKASAPNGRFAYGDGACSSNEKGLEKTEHNTRSTAHTRGFNRAVSNLVGGGECSAEEIVAENTVSAQNKPTSVDNSNSQGDLSEVLHFGKYKGLLWP